MFIRPVIACLPAWLRFAQCLRRYRDTREKIPHLINALKYSTTFSVVIFSTLNAVYKGDPNCGKEKKLTGQVDERWFCVVFCSRFV